MDKRGRAGFGGLGIRVEPVKSSWLDWTGGVALLTAITARFAVRLSFKIDGFGIKLKRRTSWRRQTRERCDAALTDLTP